MIGGSEVSKGSRCIFLNLKNTIVLPEKSPALIRVAVLQAALCRYTVNVPQSVKAEKKQRNATYALGDPTRVLKSLSIVYR